MWPSGVKLLRELLAADSALSMAYCWSPDISGSGEKGEPRPKMVSPILKVEGEEVGREGNGAGDVGS